MANQVQTVTPQQLIAEHRRFVDEAVRKFGGDTAAVDPGHRVHFHWPPESVSASFHVHASEWKGRTSFEAHGEVFEVLVARTPYGIFGKCEKLWAEAKGRTQAEMLARLAEMCEGLFGRQLAIAECIGIAGRFTGTIADLPANDLVRLLYCPNRDIGHEALTAIETHASSGLFGSVLIEIIKDRRHRFRRAAQWAALDLFEDLSSFLPTPSQQRPAILAIRDLMWDAEDDYARVVYKAGVVLGGHVCTDDAAAALLDCLRAPSKIGRRSAVHAVFHLCEWRPELRDEVVSRLAEAVDVEENELLKDFGTQMVSDIAECQLDHIMEPLFPEEEAARIALIEAN